MSNAPSTYRRRPGRAPSPPTWLWYEQIPYDDDSSDSDGSAEFESCSEDDDDYTARTTAVNVSNPTTANTNSATGGGARGVDTDHAHAEHDNSSESGSDDSSHRDIQSRKETSEDSADKMDVDSPVGANAENGAPSVDPGIEAQSQTKKDIKGKQRAVDPPEVEESPKTRERKKKSRRQVCTLRPILTIQKSQGFVWNQDLFVPPYIKDRYVASTSPPNASGFLSTSASTMGSINDYEVDVVEIRVEEGEYAGIIP